MSNIVKVTPTEAMTLGKTFAESGLFPDIKAACQAIVKIMAGQEMGIGPFQAMNGIHIIQGKATVGAGLMAAMVKGSGKYDYVVIEQTDKVCEIEYLQAGKPIGRSKFTIEDAKKAGTKNLDKYPANMLFARAMSNGVKWYTPDVFNGPVYVPDEIEVPATVQEATYEVVEATEEAISQAIAALYLCTTLDDLQNWKQTTPEVLVKNKTVSMAAKGQYNKIKGGSNE